MKKVKIQPITHESFAPFGQFYEMSRPDGYALCGEIHKFFPDRITVDSEHRLGYSPIVVKKPEKMIITQQEYHTGTWEMILPLDDDMIIHCAPASAGSVVTDYVKAFLIPKNTLVKINAASASIATPALTCCVSFKNHLAHAAIGLFRVTFFSCITALLTYCFSIL